MKNKILNLLLGWLLIFLSLGLLGAGQINGPDQQKELQLARQMAEQESRLKDEELRRQKKEEKERRLEQLAKEKEALRKQKIAERKREQEELKAKKEEHKRELAQAREEEDARRRERQWQLAEENSRRQEEAEKKKIEEYLTSEAGAQAKAEAEQAQRFKEQERLEQSAVQKQDQQKELAEQKEEKARRLEELREQFKVKQEQQLWQIAQERKELEKELAARQLERQLKKESSRKAKEQARIEAQVKAEERKQQEELQRRQRLEQLAAEKAGEERRQEELKAEAALREEVISRKKLEEKQRSEEEIAGRRGEQLARLELARQAREEAETELKVRREEKLRQEAVEKLRQEELAAQDRESRLKKEQQEKAAREKEEAQAVQARKKAKEEEVARLQQERLTQEAQVKQRRMEELASKKEEKLKQLTVAQERQRQEFQAKQQELAGRQKELQKRLGESTREALQSKAMTEVMLVKQREDNAKIDKIEKLWRRARKFYVEENYEQAQKIFEDIIVLEGNPRIKYTPYAKMYIEKAKQKIEEKKKYAAAVNIDHIDREMGQQVLTKQIPPYLEPPQKIESKGSKEDDRLVEIPLIRKKLQKQITLDFDKLDLKSVVNFLSQESGVNIIASQKVIELGLKVTARFKETAAEEAIKYITKSLGLVYRIDKDLVWLAHPEEIAKEPLETRIYYLNRGAGLFTEFSPISASSGSETGLGGSSAQITKVRTLEDTLKDAIPWPSDSKLVYDKRVNALLARNTPQNLQILEDVLYSIDVTPLQVLIEAKFIEVELTDTEELGMEWKFDNDFSLTSAHNKGGADKTVIAKNGGVDFSAFSRASEGLNLTYKGLLTTPQFETVLHALSESKKVKTLSSPRITTLNNQLATIKVVDEWIYPTRYEYQVVQVDLNGDGLFTGAGETTYKNVPKDFLRRDVGILLKVVPSVGADKKTISLSLIPEVSEGTADGFTYTGDVRLPKFTSRNLSTSVVVKSGDTVVLGGLIKEARTKTITKVPVMGDIPILGAFFRKNSDSVVRKNLLIFVTAKVLSPSGEEIVVSQK